MNTLVALEQVDRAMENRPPAGEPANAVEVAATVAWPAALEQGTPSSVEQWIADVFRPSASVWLLRHLHKAQVNQSQLLAAASQVGISAVAVRNALVVAMTHQVVELEARLGGSKSHKYRLSERGKLLTERPMAAWVESFRR